MTVPSTANLPSTSPGQTGGLSSRPIRITTLVAFFALSIAWTWIFWGAMALLGIPDEINFSRPGVILILLGQVGPLVAALALTLRSTGWKGVRSLLASALHARFSLGWYAAVLLGPGALLFLTYALGTILGIPPPAELFGLPMGGWLLALAGQAWVVVGEEYGWRGYALPRIQERFGSLTAALVVGMFWTLWHLPLFFIPGSYQSRISFLFFFPSILFDSLLYTLVYNRTGKRLASVMLLHAAQNLWGRAVPLFPAMQWIYLLLQAILAGLALRYLPRPWYHSRTLPTAPVSGPGQRPHLGWLRKIRPRPTHSRKRP